MLDIKKVWEEYNTVSHKLVWLLGRTNNILWEYAEYLACNYYDWILLPASFKSADIKDKNGKLYQVKARKIIKSNSTQLWIIRTWDFDFLIVILFDINGQILKAISIPMEEARKYAKHNIHQNWRVITTNKNFLNNHLSIDITKKL